ncbi:hypothetical protein DM793_03895 [Paenarthrobacter nitroguajacolicus]|uniref:hypothetical protein n=1 Tax=Paenarthrobacter nitroguajacolicus TaxID=211146 RepID=UPI0015BD5D75|nr:hypothetical protein [Paenarthrobacter nitroguajacolicus]NWL10445.1 hypothetical protein [Paenarthrobacter nitroguajacolicus]
MNNVQPVSVELDRADVIVLFDWLMSVDLDDVPISHPAEKQALADLLLGIEMSTDVPEVTQTEIDQARDKIATNMGW